MFLPSSRGRGGLWLALFLLLLPAIGQASSTNQADMQLQSDLSTIFVRVDQGAPLPPGGCISGYSWHTVYGGCRRAEAQAETAACPAGTTGSRIRYRNAFILQANVYDVAYGDWGAWQDSCTQARLAGVVDTVVAKAKGPETGQNFASTLTGSIAKAMQVDYGTLYGVTIYRPTATLNCVFSSGTTSGGTLRVWYGRLLAPGESMANGSAGRCTLSNGGQTAEVYGSCDEEMGGEAGACRAATRTVQIVGTSTCTVTTQTIELGRVIATNSYNLC